MWKEASLIAAWPDVKRALDNETGIGWGAFILYRSNTSKVSVSMSGVLGNPRCAHLCDTLY
jgi:hypothetical protein